MAIANLKLAVTIILSAMMFTLATSYPAGSDDPIGSDELSKYGKQVGVDLIELDTLNREDRDGGAKRDSIKEEGISFVCTFQGLLAIPKDCKSYHLCSRSGAESTSGVCLGAKRFHHQLRQCMPISEEECRATMCKKSSDIFPDPYSKDKYLVCNGMVPEIVNCAEGLIFRAGQRECSLGSILKGMKASFEEEIEKQTTNLASKVQKVKDLIKL